MSEFSFSINSILPTDITEININVSSETLLFQNLSLLGFDFAYFLKEKKVNIVQGCFAKEN